jgi:hypothetical protein
MEQQLMISNSMSWAAGFEERLGQVIFWGTRFENRLEVRGNRTGRGWFKKGQSGNPSGLPKTPPVLLEFAPHTDDPDGADRRTVGNLVVEARKYSGLAVDTLVELTKDSHTDSARYAAATALLDRGYGRPPLLTYPVSPHSSSGSSGLSAYSNAIFQCLRGPSGLRSLAPTAVISRSNEQSNGNLRISRSMSI